jgi:hypothetical protein
MNKNTTQKRLRNLTPKELTEAMNASGYIEMTISDVISSKPAASPDYRMYRVRFMPENEVGNIFVGIDNAGKFTVEF